MKSSEKDRTEIITTMFTAFGQGGDTKRIAIYVKMLEDFPVRLLQVACQKIMYESKFAPSIKELVDAIKSLIGTADESKRVKSWDEAWAEIKQEMHDAFIYRKPEFSTPEIEAAAMHFGWTELCNTAEDDLPTVRAQMRRMYEDACHRKAEQARNVYVLGGKESKQLTDTIKELTEGKTF